MAVACMLPSRLAALQREQVATGDHVQLARAADGAWWVHSVAPRRSELSRPDPHNPRLRRVLAANIDLVVHVASVRSPPLVPALLDRFLIAIAQSGAEPMIAINKCDLATPPPPPGDLSAPLLAGDRELVQLEPYRKLGIPIVLCAASTGQGIESLRRHLAGRTTVFAGHSGVGKSSLLNALGGHELAAIGTLGGRGKGRHTTTRAALIRLADDTCLIDTPGIRELGLWQLGLADLARHFPDIAAHASGCRFRNCGHSHEPGCSVRQAVAGGELDAARLDTYHRIRASLAPDTP